METTDLEYQASEISRILDSGIEIMPNSPIHLKLKRALALLSVVKPLKEGYKKGFDEWFKNESIETDGKDIYINDVPLRDSDSLIDVYESVEHQL